MPDEQANPPGDAPETQNNSISNSIVPAVDPHADDPEWKVKKKWLRPYHFKPGHTGNPHGRPRKLRMTEALQWVLGQPYPTNLRQQLENKLGITLRKDLTFAHAIAIGRAIGAVVDTATMQAILDRVEGPVRQSFEVAGPNGAPLLAPILITQYVELAKDGTPVKVIDIEAEQPKNGDSNGDAGPAALPNSLPENL